MPAARPEKRRRTASPARHKGWLPAQPRGQNPAAWHAQTRSRTASTKQLLTGSDISFINIFGTYFATKADALKDWTSEGCKVKSVSITDAVGTMLSPTVGILTFNGGADGTCFGQKVGPIWGTSIYVKDGATWKWTFGINLPAPGQDA
jgi:hypothetical protein